LLSNEEDLSHLQINDEHSFTLAAAVARAIVTERHDRTSLVSNIACDIAAEIIEELHRAQRKRPYRPRPWQH
jgi:hypothetical protein